MTFALLGCLAARSALAGPELGQAAPDFSGIDSNGQTHHLADDRGKTVVLEWTNDECPFVQKHYGTGNMQRLQKETTGQGVVWLSVISSAPGKQGFVSPSRANELTAQRGAAPTAVILDPEGNIGRLYGAKTTPHLFIIDTAGTLRYMGGIDDKPTHDPADVPIAKNYVRAALSEALAGKPVAEPVTRPYGCSVKY